MLIDTVGLVRRLPHHLVDAFKSTLEEALWADVILNVCDASSEECSELAQALNKYVIYKATNNIEGKKESELIDNIFEEMADVYIMLNQLQLILGNTNMAFENWLEKKLERLEERCAEKKKEGQ